MALALLGGAAKAIGGGIVKNVAKDKAKDFITGKKKKIKPEAIKKSDDSSTPEKGGSALAVRPQTSLVPQITPVSVSEVSSESKSSGDILTLIKTKVFEIDKFLKGSLAQEKASSKKDKKSDEKQKRKKQEGVLEKIAPKPKGILNKITAPAKGLFDGIFNFISNILLGRLLVTLIESRTDLPGGSILMFIAGTAEKIIDVILGVLDAAGTFLLWGKKAYEGTKGFIEDKFGEGAGEAFEGLMSKLNEAFNLISIIALGVAAFNPFEGLGKDKNKRKVKLDKRGRDVNKRRQVKKDFDRIRKENPKLSRKEALARAERNNRDVKRRDQIKKEFDKIRKENPKISKPDALKQATQAVDAPKPRGGVFGFLDKAGDALKTAAKGTIELGGKGLKALGGGLNFLSGGNLGKLGGFLQDQYKNASDFARRNYDKVVAVGQKLKSKYNSAMDSAKGALQKLGEAAQKRILQPVLDKLKPFTDPIIEMAKKLQGVIMNNLKKIPGFDNILQVLKKKGISSLGDVGNIMKKVGSKALPVVGGIFNLLFAYDRLANGDTIGALLETLSAGFDLAGLAPGGQFGPPISMGIDAYMFARDFVPAIQETEESVVNGMGLGGLKSNLDRAASKLPDLGSLVKMFTGGGKEDESKDKASDQTGTSTGYGSDVAAGDSLGSVKTGDLDPNSGASNVSGEAGKFVERNLESAAVAADGYGDYNKIIEHPDFGGVRGSHASGSYHYSGRAIDIGAFTNEQAPIVDVINQFNKKKGVQPVEMITGASFPGTTMVDPGGHGDHVHLAYGLGGLVKGITHAMLGEKGKEFVIDNDSYTAIEGAYPGLFDAINDAEGKDAVEALMAYTDYERPPEPEMAMAGGSSSGGSGSYGDTGGESMVSPSVPEGSSDTDSSWKDIRYKFG